jgi:hypothetical protein
MDFNETPFGGKNVEVPLVTLAVIRPGDHTWSQYYEALCPSNLSICHSQMSIAGYIQERLYLGLLASLCDTTISGYDLSASGQRWSRVISSEMVKLRLVNFQLSVLRLGEKERKDVYWRHKNILLETNKAADFVERRFSMCSSSSDLVDLILLSVRVLIGTVYRCYYDWLPAHNYEIRVLGLSEIAWHRVARRQSGQVTAADRILEANMIKNGWCTHQIHKVLSTFSYQAAYYVSKLPRLGNARVMHKTCKKNSCRGWNSKPGLTRPRHVTESCSCTTISISSMDVAKIIQGGDIPLVSIEEDAHGSLTLKLHTRRWFVQLRAFNFATTHEMGLKV